jgi:hypothetical protein
LKYVGGASDVVLGMDDVGGDAWGQSDYIEQEFDRDQAVFE